MRATSALRNGCCLILGLLLGLDTPTLLAQAPQAQARDLSLLIPDAPAIPGGDRRVLVPNAAGTPVVAKVHVEAGDRFIVLMPDGRLNSVLQREATPTDRPFKALTHDELIAQLTKESFAGFKSRKTKRYIYLYSTSDEFAKATSTILETMYPALYKYCEREKLDVHEPEVPLVAVMFRTEKDFQAFNRMPEGVLAYYSGVANFVIMYEQSDLADLAPELAIKQSISTIAHEGVHQILHNIGVQHRLSRWPMWISEGLPEYFAPTEAGQRVRWKGVGLVNDLRMYEITEMLKRRSIDGVTEEVSRAESLTSTGYAMSWATVHYLTKMKRKEFFAYLREVSTSYQPLTKPDGDSQQLFQKHFGSDFRALDKGLATHLGKQKYIDPIANQTHYLVTLNNGGLVRAMVTTSPAEVRTFIAQNPGARYTVDSFPDRASATRAMGR